MGFFEMLIIAVVTLLVVGPERMPEAVRSVALTVGRLKRSFNNARDEIEKQVGADDIRRQLHNEAVMDNVNKIKDEFSELNQNISDGEYGIDPTDDDYYEQEQRELHKNDEPLDPENKNTPTV